MYSRNSLYGTSVAGVYRYNYICNNYKVPF